MTAAEGGVIAAWLVLVLVLVGVVRRRRAVVRARRWRAARVRARERMLFTDRVGVVSCPVVPVVRVEGLPGWRVVHVPTRIPDHIKRT